MKALDAQRLRDKSGSQHCDHPELEKEYANGISTGDYVCTKCGETGWGRDWARPAKEHPEPKQ